jgi:hypothetical protein
MFGSLAQAYASGETIKSWAKRTKQNYQTARTWAMKPEFRKAVQDIQASMFDVLVGKLNAAMEETADGILGIARKGSPDSVRLAAWRAVIDDLVKVRQITKIEADIEAIKAQLDASGGTGNAKVDSGS